jgi:predicted nicotinamide N-methyase
MSGQSPALPEPFQNLDLPPLPAMPGGWTDEPFEAFGRRHHLLTPKTPDALLDDPDVIRAHQQSGYMPYWGYVWPASHKMLAALAKAPWPAGSDCLELGAGTGIVGLAAMARGDRVTFSDYDATSCLVCRYNAIGNGYADPPTIQLDWRTPDQRIYPVIVGCEVTYERGNHALLLGLLDAMLAPDGVCWLGEPGRYWSRFFFDDARQRFQVRVLNEACQEIAEPRSDSFQIYEIRK